ncbi:MAG: MCE family protein [Sciscionella sp.]
MGTKTGQDIARGVAVSCVLALLVAAGLWYVFSAAKGTKVTAYFTEAIAMYPGADVDMLGVKVGSVDTVTPMPTKVKIEMSVDKGMKIPADTTATIVSPTLVSGRYVELQPYTAGPTLKSGAVISNAHTGRPAEVDDLYRSLDKLSVALGPKGANSQGKLSNLLNVLSANLKGNGSSIKSTINQLGQATQTLSGSQKGLFDTVDNLAKFTTALQSSDSQVREFSQRVQNVSGFLSGERHNLAAVVSKLSSSLKLVKNFVNENHAGLKSNVDNLKGVTKALLSERAALAEALDVAPLALDNVTNAYNASSGTLDARPVLQELSNPPIVMVCNLLKQATSALPPVLGNACDSLAPVLQGAIPLPTGEQIIEALNAGKLPALPTSVLNPIAGAANSGGAK